jgi:uncharacterized membrane protein YesL
MSSDEPVTAQPDHYVRRVFTQLWENLPGVLVGAIAFSLFSAPAFSLFSIGRLALSFVIGVLTIAPAWAGLLAYEFPIYADRATNWRLYWDSFLRYWRRSVLLGGMAALPFLTAYVKLPLLDQEEVPVVLWLSFAADFLAAAVIVSLLLYAFPLMVRNDLGLGTTLRNAWILVGRRPMNTIGLMAMTILFGLAIEYVSLGLLFVLPAVFGLFVIGNCEAVLQQT